MISALRRRLSREDGVSLVEVLAALMIVGVVLMALTSTTLSSIAAAGGNERQSRASQVGNGLLETMQGLPFSEVTFYSGDFPPPATAPPGTVQTGGSRPAGARVPLPMGSTAVDGTTYQHETRIVWGDDPSDGISCSVSPGSGCDADPSDYKLLTVLVTWQAGGQTRSLRFDGRRSHLNAAGAISPFELTSFFITPADAATNPSAMDQLLSTSSTGCTTSPVRYRLRVALTVTVTVNRPASSVTLTGTDPSGVDPTVTVPLTSSDGGLSWTAPIAQSTCLREGNKMLTYTAQPVTTTTVSEPPKTQQELQWFGRQEEQFVTIANVVLEQSAVITRSPSRSRCETVMRFDVRGVSDTTPPSVRFTYASDGFGDTVVATHTTASGSASAFRVNYSYTTTAPGVRAYRAVITADANMGAGPVTLTARADVPTGDFDEELRSLPVFSGSSC